MDMLSSLVDALEDKLASSVPMADEGLERMPDALFNDLLLIATLSLSSASEKTDFKLNPEDRRAIISYQRYRFMQLYSRPLKPEDFQKQIKTIQKTYGIKAEDCPTECFVKILDAERLRHAMQNSDLIDYTVTIKKPSECHKFIVTEIIPLTGLDHSRRELLDSLDVLLANILKLGFRQDRKWLSIDLDQKYWSSFPNRYNPSRLKHGSFKRVLELLQETGLIELKRDFMVSGKRLKSRLRSTEGFLNVVREFNLMPLNVKLDVISHPSKELLILKDDKKKYTDYVDSKSTNGERGFIRNLNRYFESVKLLDSKGLPVGKVFRRVFNDSSFSQGGRFYSEYQNLPKDDRLRLTIDGERVVEFDYRGLHIKLLYALIKEPLPTGDVYLVEGYEHYRDLFKKALQAALNASTPKSGAAAIQLSLNLEGEKGITGKQVMEIFRKRHEKIAHYFCSGIGKHLQFLDSQMAAYILEKAMAEGKVVFPVHDSFITVPREGQWLKDAMELAGQLQHGVSFEVEEKTLKE